MKHLKYSRGLLITLLCFAMTAAVAVALISYTGSKVTEEQRAQLEASLRKAAINAYAIDGRYPSLEEIQTRYGVIVDSADFVVYYDAFASDVLPDIDVRIREEAR